MNQTVNLQIPISVSVKNRALATAKSLGFSSLQDSIRLFLHQLASQSLDFTFKPKVTKLSAKNEKRYLKMVKDYRQNKNIVKTTGLKDFFAKLNSDRNSLPQKIPKKLPQKNQTE